MATLIGEKWETSVRLRQGKNGILIKERDVHYTVQASSTFAHEDEVLSTPGLPPWGAVIHGMSVKSINADRSADDDTRWDVAVGLSSEVEESQEETHPGGTSTPLEWTPIASVTFEPYDEMMRKDLSNPVKYWMNSARRVFDTGFVRTRRIANVPFSQFEPISTTLDQIMDRCDTVNSTAYKTRAAKKLLLNVENAVIVTAAGFRCWRVDYSMKFKEDTWLVKQLDHGPGFYDGTGNYKQFFEEQWVDGTYDSAAAGETPFVGLLNGTGGALTNQKDDDPVFLEFNQFTAINFNTFLRVLFT